MPQMSPLMWLNLYFYFILLFMIMFSLIYYLYMYTMNNKLNFSVLNKNFYNLLW